VRFDWGHRFGVADRSQTPLGEAVDAVAGTRRRQLMVASISLAFVVAAAVSLDVMAGSRWVRRAVLHARPGLLVGCALLQLLALLSYAIPYWVALRMSDGPQIRLRQTVLLSVTGFSAFLPWGGFDFDKRVLARQTDMSVARSATRVLGDLEYIVLSPAAWTAALILVISGAKGQSSLYLSWIIGVPTGAAVATAAIKFRDRIPRRWAVSRWISDAMRSLCLLGRGMLRPSNWVGLAGMVLYWAAEIGSFWIAFRIFGVSLSMPAAIVALATGYTPTRRTLPMAGSGIAAALLCLATIWVGVPLQRAVAGVIAYHAICIGVATVTGALTTPRRRVRPRTSERPGWSGLRRGILRLFSDLLF
jgi:hypothetical protein